MSSNIIQEAFDNKEQPSVLGKMIYEAMKHSGYRSNDIRHAAVYMISQANIADLERAEKYNKMFI